MSNPDVEAEISKKGNEVKKYPDLRKNFNQSSLYQTLEIFISSFAALFPLLQFVSPLLLLISSSATY